jgi:membrane-bound lytic murein transglycosylase B
MTDIHAATTEPEPPVVEGSSNVSLPPSPTTDPRSANLEPLYQRIDTMKNNGMITERAAAMIKKKLSEQDDKHLTAEEGKELLDIIERAPSDKQYIENAINWGGLALLKMCPNKASFIAHAEQKYGESAQTDPINFQNFEQVLQIPAGDGTISEQFVSQFNNGEQDAAMIKKWSQYAAQRYGVDVNPNIIAAIYGKETTFGHNVRASSAGAQGHMQIMPDTMTWLEGLHPELKGLAGAEKQFAAGSLYYGYLKEMFNSDRAAIMSYNMGQGNYQKFQDTGSLPGENQRYIAKISGWLEKAGITV